MSRFQQDRHDNFPPRRPQPRPAGGPRPGPMSGPRPGPAVRPSSSAGSWKQPQRPSGPPPGAARFKPIEPASGKQRRRMAKAAAWRLGRLLHVRPAEVLASRDLQPMIESALPRLVKDGGRGQAARLAAKISRLRERAPAAKKKDGNE
ncbi:MAG TPA: hypothetical protein VFC78_07660 [Tepidisphaeraceae bacterium]|nr:hypothetical protein [Tepidisphaeraceae bacterium]